MRIATLVLLAFVLNTAQAKPQSTNKPAPTAKKPASQQTEVCELQINSNDMMQFDKKKLTIASTCKRVRLTLHHTGKLPKAAMGHNWVLTKSSDQAAVVAAGVSAGLKSGYLLPNDARVIAATAMIGGGEKTTVEFSVAKLQAKDSYSYFCTFPGHVGLMAGEFVITK